MTPITAITSTAVGAAPESELVRSGGWFAPTIAIVVVLSLGVVAALIFREIYHRRRREELQNRLADLEGILVGLSTQSPPSEAAAAFEPSTRSSVASAEFAPRGPLSTAISILRNDMGPGLPGPDRVDLRATLFVYDKLDQPITPTDLADDLNLSLRSLQRGLSSTLNCTPRELILAVKMREGKRFLLDEDCRVQEAARAVGFDDPFHFSRRFKAYYQMSPSEMQTRRSRSVA
jgi:AraC-like DNA-binding protein